jgi:hypothetical protein
MVQYYYLSCAVDSVPFKYRTPVTTGNEIKVPKCEIFHLFDSRHFYTIKASWIGDFGTKINI